VAVGAAAAAVARRAALLPRPRLAPRRGMIGIFNRSYYEETLVVRVHPEYLKHQQVPPELVTKDIWDERFQDIRKYERYMARNGTIIRKFFLHVSRDEQKKRFLERIDDPAKNWKFSPTDVAERAQVRGDERAAGAASDRPDGWIAVQHNAE
jgi:polyphosphate kinase 2 (PPK2 family)